MVLTLYKLEVSPPARAVVMTIKALGIQDVVFKELNVLAGENMTPEFLAMNPMHTVPTIKDDDFAIADSHAIIMYLVSKYGKDDSLYPKDIKERAVINQRLHFDTGILFDALKIAIRPLAYFGENYFRPENLEKIIDAYVLFERLLTTKWMAGDKFTIADICAVATMTSMNATVPVDKERFPNIYAWFNRCITEQSVVKDTHETTLQAINNLFRALGVEGYCNINTEN